MENTLVPFIDRFRPRNPSPATTARLLGWGRVGIGLAFLADPVTSVRVLGVDTATAKRMTFLARMTAGRDIVLGIGAVFAPTPQARAGWVAAGAAADVVDCAAIGAGTRTGLTGGPGAPAIAIGAAAAAVLGFRVATRLARQ
jgi:hypothetical protein